MSSHQESCGAPGCPLDQTVHYALRDDERSSGIDFGTTPGDGSSWLNKSGSLSRKGRIVEAVMYCSESDESDFPPIHRLFGALPRSPQSGLIFPFFPIAGLQ